MNPMGISNDSVSIGGSGGISNSGSSSSILGKIRGIVGLDGRDTQ